MPLTPGLSPSIRQVFPEVEPAIQIDLVEDGDTPKLDQRGNVLEIEHGDGSISISLDGKPLDDTEASEPKDWFDNLVDDIDQMELGRISDEILKGVADDIESRKDWIENRATGIKLLGLKLEIPGLQGASDGAPIEGMSKVRHPLLLEAVLRFQANARSELLPTDGPVKIRDDDNNATLQEDVLANALETDLNHFLTTTATEYYPDTDRMLLMLGFGGTAFKKVYYCPLRNRPVSETVDADDLIVNNAATDLRNAKRITHRTLMRPSIVKRLQILGVYKDIDLSQAKIPTLDSVQREKNAQQGITGSANNPDDRDREIYECYCELDILGLEHKYKGKVSGLEIPYRVTIDVSSKQILSIVRNYEEDDKELPEARINFVKYSFVPGLGFYDIGLLHILGNTTNAITAAWRELLDAGMYSNFPGFLMADTGARQNTNIFRVPPGGGALVKTGGLPINQAIMALPYKEPSGALMSLVQNMAETGMRIGGTSEAQVGEGRADAPVGTTLAMIDQATKVMNAVHKRMHSAQAEEFRLLVRTFKDNPESFWQRNKKPAAQWDQQTFLQAIEDYELTPQADPNTASHSQRMMKISGLMQLMGGAPDLFDKKAVYSGALQGMGWSNPEQFYAKPPPPPDIQSMIMGNPMLIKEVADLLIKKQDSDTKKMVGQAQAAELNAKAQQPPPTGPAAPPPVDPMEMQIKAAQAQADIQLTQAKIAEINAKTQMDNAPNPADMLDLQLRQQELAQKTQDAELDAVNRKRDRESRERIAAVKLAEDIAANPQAMPIVNQIIDPGMIQRLESNEPPLKGGGD